MDGGSISLDYSALRTLRIDRLESFSRFPVDGVPVLLQFRVQRAGTGRRGLREEKATPVPTYSKSADCIAPSAPKLNRSEIGPVLGKDAESVLGG